MNDVYIRHQRDKMALLIMNDPAQYSHLQPAVDALTDGINKGTIRKMIIGVDKEKRNLVLVPME